MEKEFGPRTRILTLTLNLIEQPYHYTKKSLAQKFAVSEDTIKSDFEVLRNVGFILEYDNNYRYSLKEEKTHLQLKQLLHFTEEDQVQLEEAIDQISPHTSRGQKLKQKLSSLYDYRKLGNFYLRKPYLSRVDALLKAKQNKKQVILKEYRSSNSSEVKDRRVEPFHPSPPDDMLHAFDIQKKELRHYRISRFKRVEILNQSWEYETLHQILPTDPFRIVNKNQVMVMLQMGVGAYNELTERFPLTKAYLMEGEEEGTYDFQCMVNDFRIEVLEPESLMQHLKNTIGKMKF